MCKNGGWLTLNGLTSLSECEAESLSKSQHELNLNGVVSLSDGAAESLSKHEGPCIYLEGLTSLSDAAAESLSKYEGGLSLDGLSRLSKGCALSTTAAFCLREHLSGVTAPQITAVCSGCGHFGTFELDDNNRECDCGQGYWEGYETTDACLARNGWNYGAEVLCGDCNDEKDDEEEEGED